MQFYSQVPHSGGIRVLWTHFYFFFLAGIVGERDAGLDTFALTGKKEGIILCIS